MKETKENQKGQAVAEEPNDTGKKKIRMLGIGIIVSIVVAGIIFYIWKIDFYKEHFFPNTYINGVNCSELDAKAVEGILEKETQTYQLSVIGRDEAGKQIEIGLVSASDMGLRLVDGVKEAEELLALQEPEKWIFNVLGENTYRYNVVHVTEYDKSALKAHVMEWDALKEENMINPENAYVSEYIEELGNVKLVPEVNGTKLDMTAVFSCIESAIVGGDLQVDLEEQGCYLKPERLATDATLLDTYERLSTWLGTKISYDWNTHVVEVDHRLIKDWIIRDENDLVVLNEKAVVDFVAETAGKYDTYGKKRSFVTTSGREIELGNGGFGWRTDREAEIFALLELIKTGAVVDREPIYNHTAPRLGMDDIGNSYVEADLTNQHLYLYHKGNMVFETDFVSGSLSSTPDCVTPSGLFDITYKTTNAVLRGGDYEQPVTYWMPFFGNYGMHDATWRTEFGGDIYITDGSHGCINLPLESAAVIYGYMHEGFPVICYY